MKNQKNLYIQKKEGKIMKTKIEVKYLNKRKPEWIARKKIALQEARSTNCLYQNHTVDTISIWGSNNKLKMTASSN